MSAIHLLDPTTLALLFEFDADLKESRSGETKWTDKPIESGSNIADYGYNQPQKYDVEGVITAWPWNLPRNPGRVIDAAEALAALRKRRQPVVLVTWWFSADVVIVSERVTSGQGDGELVRVAIQVQTYELPKPAYVTIPASSLKPAVKKRATPKPAKGGAAAGKTKPTGGAQQTDWIYKIGGFLGMR